MIRRVQNPAFDESVRLLLALHELIASGKGDDAEADDIRDQMDEPWYEMTPFERDLVNDLSADLYTIGHRHPDTISGVEKHSMDDDFNTAVQQGHWTRVLSIVREAQGSLPADDAALIRGVAWIHLSQPEVGVRFLGELKRLRPLSDRERIWLLTCLMQTERVDETMQVANEFAKSPNPLVRLRASNALSLAAQRVSDQGGEYVRDRAIEIAEESLDEVELMIPGDRTAEVLWQSSLFQLALDYQESGKTAEAVGVCNRILKRVPDNFDAQMLLDWLTFEDNPVQSRQRSWRHLRNRLPQRTALEMPDFSLERH